MAYKQAIILRTDLGMGKGKLVAQGAHASLESYLKSSLIARKIWRAEGAKKVVLKVGSEKELLELYKKAKSLGLSCALIKDAAKTQLKEPAYTAIAIGPEKEEKIDEITGNLKLL